MNTDKHGSENWRTRDNARLKSSADLSEPKLTKAEKAHVKQAWLVEIRRRSAEARAGKVKWVSAEAALVNAYRAINVISTCVQPGFINTGFQPGDRRQHSPSAVSTASCTEKALKCDAAVPKRGVIRKLN